MKKQRQLELGFRQEEYRAADILENIRTLIWMHQNGRLGGEQMPEDSRPSEIKQNSSENFHFLTLPMALNYQRNSYTLWESAAKAYLDRETRYIFDPRAVKRMSELTLRELLGRHKVALQPTKHTETWRRISYTIVENFDGDIRNLFRVCNNDVLLIRELIQKLQKKDFPYLSGPKIFNYWLHVIEQYTPTRLGNRSEITVAPDTHIIQCSLKLGLVTGELEKFAQNRDLVSEEWKRVLSGTDIAPIDIHTPLWLWSRRGFPTIERN